MPKQKLSPQPKTDLDVSEGVALFTDGSSWAKDHSGGWAWLAVDVFGGELSASGYEAGTTNNRMEMMAWIEGLVTLAEKYGPCDILVYSDSQYVGFGVTQPGRNNKANKDLWILLTEAVALHEYIEFIHVKGHSGHELNERVDKMAGEARRAGQLT